MFSRDTATIDGLRHVCKQCCSLIDKAYRKTVAGKAKTRRSRENSEARHRSHAVARKRLQDAVRRGKIVPWPACAVPECTAKPEAHHPDYGRPLDVVWLCGPHHRETHQLIAEPPAVLNRPASAPRPRGEKGGKSHSTLSDAQVLAIVADTRRYRAIADEYGVSISLICLIRTGGAWSHVTGLTKKVRVRDVRRAAIHGACA